MSTDENKALAFRYFDQRWNHNNDAVIDELLGEGMSPEDEKAHLEATHAAFGEIEFTIDGMPYLPAPGVRCQNVRGRGAC